MCFDGAYNYSGLVRRVHVVLSTAGFKGGGKPFRKTRETTALRRSIHKTLAGFEPKPFER